MPASTRRRAERNGSSRSASLSAAEHPRAAAPPETPPTASIGAGTRPTLQIRRSGIHGRGLFTLVRIARGALIGTYEGPRTRRNGAYVLWVDDDGEEFGIAGKNDLRFVNHSKSPNAIFLGEELYSLRAIRPGEEITFDYGEGWD
jgi:hypothetical protein